MGRRIHAALRGDTCVFFLDADEVIPSFLFSLVDYFFSERIFLLKDISFFTFIFLLLCFTSSSLPHPLLFLSSRMVNHLISANRSCFRLSLVEVEKEEVLTTHTLSFRISI